MDQSNRPHLKLLRFDRRKWSLKTIESGDEDVIDAAFDLEGRYRIRVLRGDSPNEGIVFHRATDEDPWEEITFPAWWEGHGFDTSGSIYYLSYPENGKRVLRGFDLVEGEFTPGIVSDPVYGIEPSLIRDPGNGAVLGFSYDADKPVVRYTDPTVRSVMDLVQRSFPDRAHRFVGLHAQGGIIFESWGDRYPHQLSRLRLQEGELSLLGNSRPRLVPEELGRMYPFSCETRDGATVHGYYTLPASLEEKPAEPLPTVVLVHGGPRDRDRWAFNPEVQFYARMGYAVLQVNYRGSSSLYSVHDLTLLDACRLGPPDVADATRWAIAEGIADPARIAINGGSFGGYIALACAADDPELYRCAVGLGGVYDMDRQLVEEMRDPTARRRMLWHEAFYGDLERNRDIYSEVSPLHRAANVRIPVYLLHGGADDTVYRSQSIRMEKALRQAGVEVEIDTPWWFGHGALNEEQNIRYNKRIYRFIEKHIGPARQNPDA